MISWRKPNMVGIDLGSSRVKLARLDRHRADIGARVGMAPVDLQPEPSPEVWLDLVQGAVQLAAERAGTELHGQRVAFLLPPQWTEVRSLPAVNLTKETAPAEVAAYVERELGSDLAGCVWDYWFAEKDGEPIELLVVFARMAYADRIARLALRLRCELATVDALPWAHYRLFRLAMPQCPEGGVVLEWGLTQAWFTLVGRHAPLYCRRLPRVRFVDVVDRLSEALGISPDVVLAALREEEQGGPQAKLWHELLDETSHAVVHRFSEEVQRTLEFARSRYGSGSTDIILATGGVFALAPVRERVTALLGQAVHGPRCSSWQRWPLFPLYGTACALAALDVADATVL